MFSEEERLQVLRVYDILDTPKDGAFDAIAQLTADLINVPIALISLVDSDRIWLKSSIGLAEKQLPKEPGMCVSAIVNNDFYEIKNTILDIRTKNHSLVRKENGIRFYAAYPLTTIDGYNLGTLCVMDTKPRILTKKQKDQLKTLAGVVMEQLELRLKSRLAIQAQHNLNNMVSHDLNNSLGNIPILMDILLEQAGNPDKVKNIAKLAKNTANKGFEALQKYMIEARKLTNPFYFKKEIADLSEIVKSVIQQNEPAALKKKQIIQTSLPDKLVCKADPGKMTELVDNLLSNAIKYSPLGKNIYIELTKDLQFTTLIVKDYGQGMTKEDLKKAFTRYQTLSAKPTGDEKSHGLGLWIVKVIAEQHGGSVTVHSEGRDKGCQFVVKIPLK